MTNLGATGEGGLHPVLEEDNPKPLDRKTTAGNQTQSFYKVTNMDIAKEVSKTGQKGVLTMATTLAGPKRQSTEQNITK